MAGMTSRGTKRKKTLTAALSSWGSSKTIPDVKSYPDAVYFNYYTLGLSLLFVPVNGYVPLSGASRQDLQDAHLILDGVDIYNNAPSDNHDSKTGFRSRSSTYSSFPITPITITLSPESKDGTSRPSVLNVTQNWVGKDFVAVLGEPDRKGGGSGPSSGSIGIWVEWIKDGLMVEFGGDDSRGPQAWEKGKDAPWRVISIFSPKNK
ncbi:hypothetical protein B0F90DRAFT_1807132 [Multifurca ochricompacta]|uniref:Uncharacterized protein n=1 Tax=Multifurca ochricompacta TaxID=376703 RepID=A0AAD4MCQ8_9AGAM|nr:hypothetical protein B0F90DRAFT_1807132 [Multifurca ochricompacta]